MRAAALRYQEVECEKHARNGREHVAGIDGKTAQVPGSEEN